VAAALTSLLAGGLAAASGSVATLPSLVLGGVATLPSLLLGGVASLANTLVEGEGEEEEGPSANSSNLSFAGTVK